MPTLYVLVGVPGSGKSTWISNQDWIKDCAIVSTDIHVETYAKSVDKTYTEIFEEYMPTAVKLMTEDVIKARAANKDIIWDQTSTTVLSRKKKFKMLPNYYAIAIVFRTPQIDELRRRIDSRVNKIVPWHVVENMLNNFETPSDTEGFKEIWYVN